MSLGQSVDTLSRGERPRLELAGELERDGGIVVLDEPAAGLHRRTLRTCWRCRIGWSSRARRSSSSSTTVVLQADGVIDRDPAAGDRGGSIVFDGRVAELLGHTHSPTATFLRRFVARSG